MSENYPASSPSRYSRRHRVPDRRRGAGMQPIPDSHRARLPALHEPVRGPGQRVRLRRLVPEGCNYVCETGAKANSAYRTVPAAIKTGNFTLDVNSYVFRLDTDSHGTGHRRQVLRRRRATSTCSQRRYSSTGSGDSTSSGSMLLSGIGNPYNPTTVSGSLGQGMTEANVVGPYTLGDAQHRGERLSRGQRVRRAVQRSSTSRTTTSTTRD